MAGLKFRRLVPANVRAGGKPNHHVSARVHALMHIVNLNVRLAPMRRVFADWSNGFWRLAADLALLAARVTLVVPGGILTIITLPETTTSAVEKRSWTWRL